MAMQTFALQAARIAKFKGQILKHAVPVEVLSKAGRQIQFPKNNSDTYVARRWLPYGATATSASTINQFFQTSSGTDRGNVVVQAHQIQEGVTPAPDSMIAQDITVVMQQYGCLYGFSDKTEYLYEDDVPDEMQKQVGERVALVNEVICWGQLRAGTNTYYGGTGTTIATVNGGITLGFVRKIAKNLQANHGRPVNTMLGASNKFNTAPVETGYTVYGHTDMEPDIRDIPNFVPTAKYATGSPMPNEIGTVERFRFITSPDLPSLQDAGALIGSTNLFTTSGTSLDVYPFIVTAQDAWSQVAVRGLEALKPAILRPSDRDKADPLGQRGYVGTTWWKAVMRENEGWMAIGFVGVKNLS